MIRHLDDESLLTEFNEMQIVGYRGKASAAWSEMARRGLVAKNPKREGPSRGWATLTSGLRGLEAGRLVKALRRAGLQTRRSGRSIQVRPDDISAAKDVLQYAVMALRKPVRPVVVSQAPPWQVPGAQWAPFVGPREDAYFTVWARPLTLPFWEHPIKQMGRYAKEEWIIKVFRGREEWGDEVWRLAGLTRKMVDEWIPALESHYRSKRAAVVVDLDPDELYTMRPGQSSGWAPGAQGYAGPQAIGSGPGW